MRYCLFVVCLLLSAVACAQDSMSGDDSAPVGNVPGKVDYSKIHIDQRLGAQVPLDARFTDRNGRAVLFGDLLQSRPALVLPVFYKCAGVCALELQNLVMALPKLKQRIGKDYDVVIMSIDPQEGPDLALKKFQTTFDSTPALRGTENGWHFLTGSLDNIHAVTDALGFHYTYDAKNDLICHPSGIMFVTPTGAISSYVLGANYDLNKLSLDLNVANANKLGKETEYIFFGCIHCDPITGKKSIVIERFLSLLALLTVAGIVTTISVLSVRSRRASSSSRAL